MEKEDEEQEKNKQKAAALKAKQAESAAKNKEADLIGAKDADQLTLRGNTNYDYSTTARQKRQNRTSDWVASEATPTLSAKAISSEADYTPAAQKRKQATSDQMFNTVVNGEAYLRDANPANNGQAELIAKGLLNTFRSGIGTGATEASKALIDQSQNAVQGYKKGDPITLENRDAAKTAKIIENDKWLINNAQDIVDKNYIAPIRETADQQIGQAVENANTQLGKDLITSANSLANSMSYSLLGPMGMSLGMGIASGAEKYNDLREQGASYEEAAQRGGADFAITAGIGMLSGMGSPVKGAIEETAAKNLLTNVAYQAMSEGGEELLEYTLGYFADVMADKIYKGEVSTNFDISEALYAAYMGALSGGAFGVMGSAQNAMFGDAQTDSIKNVAKDIVSEVKATFAPKTKPETEVKAEAPKAPVEPPVVEAENNTPTAENEQEVAFANAEKTKKAPVINESENNIKYNNLDYNDVETKTAIMQNTHNDMLQKGQIVVVDENVLNKVSESYPDMRNVKKKDRVSILKDKMKSLKSDLRKFLSGIKGTYDFDIDGNVIEATLYDTGINEVLEKVTQNKANMLYASQNIFQNAKYLYSTPDYEGNPNIDRWNYFYTPVQIGDDVVGVRIAVRDMAPSAVKNGESQIYNWGIKKEAALGGGSPGNESTATDTSSAIASNNKIAQSDNIVNNKNGAQAEPYGAQDGAHPNTVGGMESQNKFYKSIKEFGAQPLRKEQIAKDNYFEVPKKIGENIAMSENVGYVAGSALGDNDYMDDVIQHPEKYAHIINTDANSMQNAIDYIESHGLDETYGAWRKTIDDHKMIEKDDISKAYLLGLFYQDKAKKETDPVKKEEYRKRALDVKTDINYAASKGGQLLQGIQMLQKAVRLDSINLKEDGEYMANRLVEKLNEDRKGKGF